MFPCSYSFSFRNVITGMRNQLNVGLSYYDLSYIKSLLLYIIIHLCTVLSGNWEWMKIRKAVEVFTYYLIELLILDCFTLGNLLWVPMKNSQEKEGGTVVISPRAGLLGEDLKAGGKLFCKHPSINGRWEKLPLWTGCFNIIQYFLIDAFFGSLLYLWYWPLMKTGNFFFSSRVLISCSMHLWADPKLSEIKHKTWAGL